VVRLDFRVTFGLKIGTVADWAIGAASFRGLSVAYGFLSASDLCKAGYDDFRLVLFDKFWGALAELARKRIEAVCQVMLRNVSAHMPKGTATEAESAADWGGGRVEIRH